MRLWPRRARCWQVAHRHGHGINEGYPLCLTASAIPIASQARPRPQAFTPRMAIVDLAVPLPGRSKGILHSVIASRETRRYSPVCPVLAGPPLSPSQHHARIRIGNTFWDPQLGGDSVCYPRNQVRINSEFRLVAVKAFVARTRVIPNGRWLPRYRGQGKTARRRRATFRLHTGPSGH